MLSLKRLCIFVAVLCIHCVALKIKYMKISNKDLIQSYVITTARYDFSVYEKRILYGIVESLQALTKGKKLNKRYEMQEDLFGDYVMTYDIAFFLNGESDKNYQRIKSALMSLKDKSFQYEDDKVWEYISIIESPKIEKCETKVKFRLNKRVFDAFLDFSKGYRKYELNIAMQFESVYSMRFYELFSNKTTPIIYAIDELKEMFKIQDKYSRVNDFFKRVIEPARAELDKSSPYSFKYETIKTGRKITHIKFKPFYIAKNRDETLEGKEIKKQTSIRWDLSADVIRKLKEYFDLTDEGLKNNRDLLAKAVKREDFLDICNEINAMIRKYDVNNKAGYFISQLKKLLEG